MFDCEQCGSIQQGVDRGIDRGGTCDRIKIARSRIGEQWRECTRSDCELTRSSSVRVACVPLVEHATDDCRGTRRIDTRTHSAVDNDVVEEGWAGVGTNSDAGSRRSVNHSWFAGDSSDRIDVGANRVTSRRAIAWFIGQSDEAQLTQGVESISIEVDVAIVE